MRMEYSNLSLEKSKFCLLLSNIYNLSNQLNKKKIELKNIDKEKINEATGSTFKENLYTKFATKDTNSNANKDKPVSMLNNNFFIILIYTEKHDY